MTNDTHSSGPLTPHEAWHAGYISGMQQARDAIDEILKSVEEGRKDGHYDTGAAYVKLYWRLRLLVQYLNMGKGVINYDRR